MHVKMAAGGEMKYLIATIITTVMLLGAAQAADFEKGLAAAQRGDYATALREFGPLAKQSNAAVQAELGDMYSAGKGVTQDYAKALKWYPKAAAQGDTDAWNAIAYMYFSGQGIAEDEVEGLKWWRKSAEQGNAHGQFILGTMYSCIICDFVETTVVKRDYAEAGQWYRKAAEQGDAQAQWSLGDMYDTGRGVIQDKVTAYMWTDIAGVNGSKNAQKNKDLIAKMMTHADISKAQRRAKVCMESKYKNCE